MGGKKTKTVPERLLGLYRSTNHSIRYGAWGLSIAAGLALIYLIFSVSFLDRAFPHVMVGGQNLAGMEAEEIRTVLTRLVDVQTEQKIVLHQADQTLEIAPDDIEWQVDIEATTARVLGYGRESNRLLGFWHQVRSVFARTNLDPAASYDAEILATKIAQLADTVNQPAQDAKAELINDQLVVSSEKGGQVIDETAVINRVVTQLNAFTARDINIELQPSYPKIILVDEQALKDKVDQLSQASLTLKWPTGTKKLNRKEIRQLIGFIGEGAANPTQPLIADFTIPAIQTYLTSIADLTDTPAVEPQLVIRDGKLAINKNSKDGKVVDLNVSAETVLGVLRAQGDDPTAQLTLKDDTPSINESNLASLGIKERIGYGETSFAGSPANRRHNIANGVSILSSALIGPGQEFSTVTTLGAVDNTTGFLPELVIKENRTTPEFGGGLCQVSTTLFRSVMNAGLRVTERQNHSYRVSYYEPPVGLDATIYLPKPDFKFLNDTPGHILIQARVVGSKVIFELWGTSDGRTSQISDPQILSTTPAGEPIYADTDTLPKGEQKQIEKAHDGAVTVATYTVMRNGEVINKQTFKSIYKAWPARFLVGTNESLPPTQPPA